MTETTLERTNPASIIPPEMPDIRIPDQPPIVDMPTSHYTASVVTSFNGFQALAREWHELTARMGGENVQLDHEWLSVWLSHFPPEKILVITVRNASGRLVGIAPFKINRSPLGVLRRMLRHLQFIGTEPCVYDWMKIITDPQENQDQIITEVARQLIQQRHEWDVLDLRYGIVKEQMEALARLLAPYASRSELQNTMSIPIIEVPKTFEEYDATGKRKKFGKDIKRVLTRLKEQYPDGELHLDFIPPSHYSEKVIDQFIQNHIDYWQVRGTRSNFLRFPGLGGFYKEIHRLFQPDVGQIGRFQLTVLKVGDIVLSYQFTMWQEGGHLGYLTTYFPEYQKFRPGVLHMEALIQNVIEHGGSQFSFGRGDESYKTQWNITHSLPLWDLLMFRSPWAELSWRGDEGLKTLRDNMKRKPTP